MEIWKSIPGFEEMYIISNYGNVKGLQRQKIANINGSKTIVCERSLKPYKGGKNQGYLRVCLSKDNKKTIGVIHRLVAELFIPNTFNKPAVNHIDGNKYNNNVSNLEWVTNSENMQHYYNLKRIRITEKHNNIQLEITNSSTIYL